MTELELALEDCFASAKESKGFKETVFLSGKDIEALVVDYGSDIAPSSGGDAEHASFKVVVRKIDLLGITFGPLEPIRIGPNALRAQVDLAVFSLMSNGAGMVILAGDPMSGQG